MNLLTLDALLLFVLSVPVVMRYRILPIEGTPYWLFGILFIVLLINIVISIYHSVFEKFINVKKVKFACLVITMLIVWAMIYITILLHVKLFSKGVK